MATESTELSPRFSLVAGGPFHALLGSVGLLAADQLPRARAAVVLVMIAWLPPAVLVAVLSAIDDGYAGWGYFTDPTAYSRYLVAITVMIATERYANRRILALVHHFRESGLLAHDQGSAFAALLDTADRRTSSTPIELVIAAVCLLLAGTSMSIAIDISGSSWGGARESGTVALSWAGNYARFVSTPLFQFLLLRWMWRFLAWTLLLCQIARLPLQLAPLHPDRAAGLGFLSIYPSIFSGFVFALSCVVASAFLRELDLEQLAADTVWFGLAGWIGIVLLIFLGPLTVFVRPLYLAREQALLSYGRIASQHHIAFHRKWIEPAMGGEDMLGSADPSSVSDLNASVQAVLDMRTIPVDRSAVVQLLIAAAVPLLTVVAALIPLRDLIRGLALTIF